MSDQADYCVRYGHDWALKTGSTGKLVKVCRRCGTDALREAVRTLRYFQKVCREAKPVGQWPGEQVCVAIDVVLDRIGGGAPPTPMTREIEAREAGLRG